MENAIKLIITKSPAAAEEAIRTLRAIQAGSPVVHVRYANTVEHALSDPQAEFTAEERAILADSLIISETTDTRSEVLHVRVNQSERLEIEQAAEQAGLKLSDYLRSKIIP